MRYLLIGGTPSFNGNTFTALRIVARAEAAEAIIQHWFAHYDYCGGLMTIIDCKTGEEYYPSEDQKTLIRG